ncbi:MAG: hypothetical protein RLZZ169_1648 [Pseudomonadota bacterium]|jgi:hypothetical protein
MTHQQLTPASYVPRRSLLSELGFLLLLVGAYFQLPYWLLGVNAEANESRALTIGVLVLDGALVTLWAAVLVDGKCHRAWLRLDVAVSALLTFCISTLQGYYLWLISREAVSLSAEQLHAAQVVPLKEVLSVVTLFGASVVAVILWAFERRSVKGGAEATAIPVVRYFALALFPLWPLVHYWRQNSGTLSAPEWLFVAGLVIGLPLAIGFILLWASRRRYVPGWTPAVLLGLALGHLLAPAALKWTSVHGRDALTVGTFVTTVAVVVLWLLSKLRAREVVVIGATLNALAFLAEARQPSPKSSKTRSDTQEVLLAGRGAATQAELPSIYLLVYDAYPSGAILRDLGVQDSQPQRLRQLGFEVYDSVYSVGASTLESMARLLDPWTDTPVDIDGRNEVARWLGARGYVSHLVLTPYFFSATEKGYDHLFPEASQFRTVMASILAREFRASFAFSAFDDAARLSEKRRVMREEVSHPVFLYSHSPDPGHSQNSGTCLPDEVPRYLARLKDANAEMNGDLVALGERLQESIVILAADHGPHLTGDCYMLSGRSPASITLRDLRDRYGVFLAVRWPAAYSSKAEKIRVLQHVFEHVTARVDRRAVQPAVVRMHWNSLPWGAIPAAAISGGRAMVGSDSGADIFSSASLIHR